MVRRMTPASAQPLRQRAVVVCGRRQLQRTQQRLEPIGRCSEDPLTDIPVDEVLIMREDSRSSRTSLGSDDVASNQLVAKQ
jgi:hypothetical protein